MHLVNIHRVGDAITVSSLGDSVTFNLINANYPPTAHLFAQFDNPSPSDIGAIDKVSFNPSFFADYAKIVGKGAPVTITFIAKNKPMLIGLGGDKVEWRALLMPMKII